MSKEYERCISDDKRENHCEFCKRNIDLYDFSDDIIASSYRFVDNVCDGYIKSAFRIKRKVKKIEG